MHGIERKRDAQFMIVALGRFHETDRAFLQEIHEDRLLHAIFHGFAKDERLIIFYQRPARFLVAVLFIPLPEKRLFLPRQHLHGGKTFHIFFQHRFRFL